MERLNGHVAIVTQAAQGVGRGIACRLAEEGAAVVSVDGAAASKQQAERIVADVLKRHERIDILINGAVEATDFSPLQHKQQAVGPAAQCALWMMQAAFPAMHRKGGSIVNIVSLLGDSIWRQAADSIAADEALKALTRSAAEEWGQYNILVNAVVAAADTEAFRRLRERDPETVDKLVSGTPMGRMGDPQKDIGGALMLLLGDAGRYLTGHVLYVDGGQHLTPAPFEALVPA